ncbi:MAG: DUF1349 domain-containing protein [Opitutales bacterium]|nr:DUF1349 domain-containing protein [Opitutales bacterium]
MKLFLLLFFLTSTLASAEAASPIHVEGIPTPLQWIIEPVAFEQTGATLAITAGPQTNMFYAPHGNFRVSNMPKLLFRPSNDFTLQAKAHAKHKSKWEAAMLVVYIDEDYWAKLCFENQEPGIQRMVSVVTNQISDDAYSDIVNGSDVYMRVTKKGQEIQFSYSNDGENWVGIRYFRLNSDKPLSVGFSSQSPIGQGLTSFFSDIKYTED